MNAARIHPLSSVATTFVVRASRSLPCPVFHFEEFES
jgi:hypothetical protein